MLVYMQYVLSCASYICFQSLSLFFSFFHTDSFVNSQEWTLSRTVPELKLVSMVLILIICIEYINCHFSVVLPYLLMISECKL